MVANLMELSSRLDIKPPAPQIGNTRKAILGLNKLGIEERREGREQCNRRVVLSMRGGR